MKGYKISFSKSPAQQKMPMETYFSQRQQQLILEEIQEILKQGEIHEILKQGAVHKTKITITATWGS